MTYRMNTRISYDQTESSLYAMLLRWGASDISIENRLPAKWRDDIGEWRRGQHMIPWAPDQKRVSVSFERGGFVSVSEDRHQSPADNLRVLYLCLDNLRENEMRGFGDIMRTALLQLDAPNPWKFLQIPPRSDEATITQAHKRLAAVWHPDRPGGDERRMAEINWARDEALKSLSA